MNLKFRMCGHTGMRGELRPHMHAKMERYE